MSKQFKIIIAVILAAALVGVAVWFFLFRDADDEEVWDPNANMPTGNQTVVQGDLGGDTSGTDVGGDSDLDGDGMTEVELPSSDEDGVGENPNGDTGGYAGDVDEDGIPTPEAIKAEQKEDPSIYGRLVIPVAGINVRLFQSGSSSVIKATDSAAMFSLGETTMIADAWDQGFKGLTSCAQGSEMYIVTPAGKVSYLCARAEAGVLMPGDIEYSNGSSVTDSPAGAINCYSQQGTDSEVWVVEFTKDGTTTSFEGKKDEPVEENPGQGSGVGQPTTSKDPSTSTGTSGSTSGSGSSSSGGKVEEPEDWTSGAGYEYSRP